MNLVSCEYIASQATLRGVLVLSEFAGAAESLDRSLLFNPWSTVDFAEKIHSTLVMDAVERKAR
jgi:trehalose 6-phosphate synthase